MSQAEMEAVPLALSIVIVNWNTKEMLCDCLHSLQDHPLGEPMEVIVVDNASSDGSAEAVRNGFSWVKLVANSHNAGYAEGNNQGLRLARGRTTLLLNPDVIMPEEGLNIALDELTRYPKCAALGIRLVNPDGTVQASVRGFPTPWAVLCEALGLSRLCPGVGLFGSYRLPRFNYDQPAEVDQPMGTFLLIRREALEEVGLLDEQFPIFFNEVDWCFRAKRQGWSIRYSPRVSMVHYGGGSTRLVKPQMAWESRSGLLRFYRKHFTSLAFAPIYWVACSSSWVYAWLASRLRAAKQG